MSGDPPIADARPAPSAPPQGRVELARVTLLGINAWLVALLIPCLHVGLWDARDLALFVLPLFALAPGIVLLQAQKIEWSRWILLAVYPAALGAVIASQ